MDIFKANDIRGIFPEELDRERVRRIGFYLPEILGADRILVGRDTRNSSNEVFELLAGGIRDAGVQVVDIGVCDTPAVYFATVKYGFSGSVMITASHNPPEYNGLKISAGSAVPVGPENGLKELESLISDKPVISVSRADITFLDIRNDYIDHIHGFLEKSNRLKVVIDCGNGASSIFAHDVFDGLFSEAAFLFDNPDGDFPGHGPNPLEPESRVHIAETILKKHADLGIIFDGDADRAIFMDEQGSFVSPDIITALIGQYYYGREKSKRKMFYDIRSSRSVHEAEE